jgi:hypothetical protein
MNAIRFALITLVTGAIILVAQYASAAIIGPYAMDANTLHLWHLDDSAVPVLDVPGVATPINLASLGTAAGGSLGAASFGPPSFGTAYSSVATANTGLFAKTPANSTADNTSTASFRNATTGAFTYEMIMRADFDPAVTPTSFQLISNDNDSGARDFQFTLNHTADPGTNHFLQFTQISPSIVTVDSSAFSITQGHWYHVAVTYDGNAGAANNMAFFWTDMTTNAANTVATAAGTGSLPADLSAAESDFAIGAEARNTGGNGGQFLGLIDEVRISDIARGADQFIFVPEPSAAALMLVSLVGFGQRMRRS